MEHDGRGPQHAEIGTGQCRGLGSSIYPRNIDYAAFDEVHWVAPGEAVGAALRSPTTEHDVTRWARCRRVLDPMAGQGGADAHDGTVPLL